MWIATPSARNDDNKEFKNFDNNVAFPKGRLWRAHCVNNSEERKIVKAHKGFALRPFGKTPCY